MKKYYFVKLIIVLTFFFFSGNLHAQDTSDTKKVKVVLSERLAQKGFMLFDYSVRTNPTMYGYITTSIVLSTNKSFPKIVLNIFDNYDYFLYQTDDIIRTNNGDEFKNMAYIYHCYIMNFDSALIKTVVIDQK